MLNLIWDLDGTLIDSEKEIVETLKLAMTDAKIDISKSVKPLRVGPTIDNILRASFDASYLNDEKLYNAISSFRKRYDSSSFSHTNPFMGIDDIVHDTDNYVHYIITNKPDLPSRKIIHKLGWETKIRQIITPYSFGNDKKEKSELFKYLIESQHVDKENTYGIGDMVSDCYAAKSAGIQTIGVLWGTGTRDELSDNTYLCSTVSELKVLLGTLCKK
jgi:5'-nucleotidase